MIARIWHGWTTRENADKYEEILQTRILPGIEKQFGRTVDLLRRDLGEEIEFMTICHFANMEEIKQFAGEHYEIPVVMLQAREVLERFDARAQHYEFRRGK